MTEENFDVLLLSGIIPCLDDSQMEKMVANLDTMAKPNSKLLVRSSIGLQERIDVVSQFSQDLKERYTAYYRTTEEIQESFCKLDQRQGQFALPASRRHRRVVV